MLKDRLRSAVLIFLAFLAAILWLRPLGATVAIATVSAVVLWEFYGLLDAAGVRHFKIVGLVCGVAMIGATAISAHRGSGRDLETAVLFGVVALVFLRQFLQNDNPHAIETVGATLLGILYVPFLADFFTRLLLAWGDMRGRLLIVYLIAVVKATDTGAYFVGCSWGRHKLIPQISPAKTWEGFFGGIGAGVLVSILFAAITRGHLGPVALPFGHAVLLGAILALAGTLGDLVESLLKRSAGVKDSSRLIGGMGGLLDVVDSLLVAAPVLYIYARFFLLELAR